MFISNLNVEQQQMLLSLAQHFMFVDGHGDEREMAMIERIKSQCNIPMVPSAVEMSDLPKLFTSNQAKVSLMLELLVLTLADEKYHESEKYLLNEVAKQLNMENKQMEKLKNWANRRLILNQEAADLMEEE